MNKDLFERVIMPVGLPLLALVLIEIVVISFAQVLIAAGKVPAVWIALGTAVGILVAGALIAASPRVRSSTIIGLLVLAGVGVVGAGIASAVRGPAPLEHEAGSGHEDPDHAALEVVAVDIEFDQDRIELTAGETQQIHFINQDTVPHNIAIYETEAAEADLFVGELFTGPDEMVYEVGPFEAGEYYFRCDVHPTMEGTVVVD